MRNIKDKSTLNLFNSSSVEAAFVSIKQAAAYSSESEWVIKDLLRRGVLKAKKAGRRTIVEFAGVKERAANLPNATFAPPRDRRRKVAA